MCICASALQNSDLMPSDFIQYIKAIKRYSDRTCESYSKVLEDFCAYIGPESVPTINNIRSYEVHLMDECGMSPKSVSMHLSVLSSYCRYLVKQGKLKSNPVRLVKRPRSSRPLAKFYKKEDIERYFQENKGVLEYGAYPKALNYMIINVLYCTGIRRSELISLNRGSFDASRRVLKVTGKGDKMREIPLSTMLCDDFLLYLQSLGSLKYVDISADAPLLQTPKGKRLYPVFVDRAVKEELGVAGINGQLSPHVLRHTIASQLLEEGSDINSIKEMLGHSSLAATQVYTHNSIQRLKSVYINAHPRAKNGGNYGD